jgi:dipeptidase E
MRLYLSSYGIGNRPEELVKLVGNNKKAAIILNAIDFGTEEARKERLEREIKSLSNLGFLTEELDLRNYFNKEKELEEKLLEYGLVWVRGGNSFILKRAFEQSGFKNIIKNLLKEDVLVYGGYSAAICVIQPTLQGTELVDDPNIVPEGYKADFDWNGLNLINYHVAVHYKSDHKESADIDKEVEYLEKNNIPYKPLRDGEVIIISGETEVVIS